MVKHETSCCSNQTNRKSKNIQSAKPSGDLAYGRLDIPDHEWMFIISTSNLLIVPVSPPSLSDYTCIYIYKYLFMYVCILNIYIYIYVACLIHISFASATIRNWRFHPCLTLPCFKKNGIHYLVKDQPASCQLNTCVSSQQKVTKKTTQNMPQNIHLTEIRHFFSFHLVPNSKKKKLSPPK